MAKLSDDDLTLAKAIDRLAAVHEKQLGAIATALSNLAFGVKYLGTGENASQLGAIEFLAVKIKESADTIAEAMREGI